MRDYRDITFWAVIVAALVIGLLSGCAYLPTCKVVYYKSVVQQDESQARDISSESGSPLNKPNTTLGEEQP